MMSPDLNIRIGAINRLKTELTVPIRDSTLRPDDGLPGIVLSSQTMGQDGLKTEFGGQATLLVQVIGKTSLTASRYEVDQLTDKVMKLLIPNGDYIEVDGYQVVSTTLDSLNDNVIKENDGWSMRKLIRIRFLLRQINNL